jgi:hypothetical protein
MSNPTSGTRGSTIRRARCTPLWIGRAPATGLGIFDQAPAMLLTDVHGLACLELG